MNATDIYEKINASAFIGSLIESADLGKTASVYMAERDQLGRQAIVFDTALENIGETLVGDLQRILINLFGEDLIIVGVNIVTKSGCPTKIEFAYSIPKKVIYDYSKAKDFLENVCPPDMISDSCKDALEHLWKIHSALDIKNSALTIEDFNNVSATLCICKDIAEMISEKGED